MKILHGKLDAAKAAKQRLHELAQPELNEALAERERLLEELRKCRDERRASRQERVSQLNRKTAGFVKLDIPRDNRDSESHGRQR